MRLIDLDNLTPEIIADLRAAIFGPAAQIDDSGNLSVGGNLSADGVTWVGKGMVLTPVAVADLNPNGGLQLVHDAFGPVIGQPVAGGGSAACLVGNDSGAMRVLAKY